MRFRWRRAPFWLSVASVPAFLCFSDSVSKVQPNQTSFTDVASQANIQYVTKNDFRNRKYFITPMAGGIGVLDYDSDGLMDLFFTNGASLPDNKKTDPSFYNCLLHNLGNGKFEDVTHRARLDGANLGYSFGVAVGDYDNDGRPDIFIANAGRNALFHNNGDGTFTDVTKESGLDTKPANTLSIAAAWFDYDNDGLLDLVVSEYTTWTPASDIRCTAPNGGEIYCNPKQYTSVPNRLYHNLGNGKFKDVTDESGFGKALGKGMGIAIADFNGDGLMDVFIANDTERNLLYINKGHGKFEEAGLLYGAAYNEDGTTVSGMGADAKDYNNDGWPDIFYNDLTGQTYALFQNDGGRAFNYVSTRSGIARLSRFFAGWSNGFIDYDNDGWKDIYSANGDVDYLGDNAKQHDTMWRNIDGRRFESADERLGPAFKQLGYHRGSAFVDLNNDGAMDIVGTGLNEKPRILINSGNTNHWCMLALQGTKSNRDAIGTRVKLTTGSGRTLYNHVTASVGFMGSSDLRIHFGLGQEHTIRKVDLDWPSGTHQTILNPDTDKILHVMERADR